VSRRPPTGVSVLLGPWECWEKLLAAARGAAQAADTLEQVGEEELARRRADLARWSRTGGGSVLLPAVTRRPWVGRGLVMAGIMLLAACWLLVPQLARYLTLLALLGSAAYYIPRGEFGRSVPEEERARLGEEYERQKWQKS